MLFSVVIMYLMWLEWKCMLYDKNKNVHRPYLWSQCQYNYLISHLSQHKAGLFGADVCLIIEFNH